MQAAGDVVPSGTKVRLPLADLSGHGPATLLTTVSPESRAVESLQRILRHGRVRQCVLVIFSDLDHPRNDSPLSSAEDLHAERAWQECKTAMLEVLRQEGVPISIVSGHAISDTIEVLEAVQSAIPNGEKVILDISSFPKSYVMGIPRTLGWERLIPVYTEVRRNKVRPEDFAIGVRRIEPLPGFEGRIRQSEDLLVLALGFEGPRALALFHHLQPSKTLALVGDPRDERSDEYIKISRMNNEHLLANSSVEERLVPSLDHAEFANQLEVIVAETLQAEASRNRPLDVCVSPLGTKVQALGMFHYWRRHPEVQVVYATPTKRRSGVERIGESWVCGPP